MVSHPLKTLMAVFGLAAGLVLFGASNSYAFTETKIPQPPAQKSESAAPNLQLESTDDGALSLTTPGDSGSEETELKIPGVGSIGKLPKLDFGLELLYGGGTAPGPDAQAEDQKEDVLIKGKIRHRF